MADLGVRSHPIHIVPIRIFAFGGLLPSCQMVVHNLGRLCLRPGLSLQVLATLPVDLPRWAARALSRSSCCRFAKTLVLGFRRSHPQLLVSCCGGLSRFLFFPTHGQPLRLR